MLNVYQSFFVHWLDLKGKADTGEFWIITVTDWLIVGLFYMLLKILDFPGAISSMLTIYTYIMFVPKISLTVRRLHDTGLSGFWYFLTFIPWIGYLILLGLCCRPGKA